MAPADLTTTEHREAGEQLRRPRPVRGGADPAYLDRIARGRGTARLHHGLCQAEALAPRRGGPGDRRGGYRAAPRDPRRAEDSGHDPGDPHHLRRPYPEGLGPRHRRPRSAARLRRPPPSSWASSHARVRVRPTGVERPLRQTRNPWDAPGCRGQKQRLRRGRSRRALAAGRWDGHRRLDPDSRRLLRDRGAQAHLWPRQPGRVIPCPGRWTTWAP